MVPLVKYLRKINLRWICIVGNIATAMWFLERVLFEKLWNGVSEYSLYITLAFIAVLNVIFIYRSRLTTRLPGKFAKYILYPVLFALNLLISTFFIFQALTESLKIDTALEMLTGAAFLLCAYFYTRDKKYLRLIFNTVVILLILVAIVALVLSPIYEKYFMVCDYSSDVVICTTKWW